MRHILAGHTSWVYVVAFSPDGRLVASGDGDETIRLWHVETGKCVAVWRVPGPYEGMNITGVTGITKAQKVALKALGRWRCGNNNKVRRFEIKQRIDNVSSILKTD